MMPVDVGGIIGAGISANAAVTGDVMQYLGAQEQRRAQEQLYDRQTAYQTAMANSAHQREVEDLRKAGLNPILAAGGSGAASPTAPTYQPQNLMSGVKFSAAEAARVFNEIRSASMNMKMQEADIANKQVQNVIMGIEAQKESYAARAMAALLPALENRAGAEKALGKAGGWTDAITERVGKIIGSANNLFLLPFLRRQGK